MAIEFDCPACRHTLHAEDDAAGRVIRCGNCLTLLRVPAPPGPDHPSGTAPAAVPAAAPDPGPVRPRRRTPTAGPTGRPAGRVLRGCLLAVLVMALGCGGVLVFAQPKWRPHDSAAGGFRVDLPAEPRDDLAEKGGLRVPPGVAVEGTIFPARFETYLVFYQDLPPPAPWETDEERITAVVDGLKAAHPDLAVVREHPVTVSEWCAGREVEFRGAGRVLVWRVVVAGGRVYELVVQGPWVKPDGPRTRRFLDSFAVTDPDLLKAAKGRWAWRQGIEKIRKAVLKKWPGGKPAAEPREDVDLPGEPAEPLRPGPAVAPPPRPR